MQCSSTSKQKILSLIKKLERLADGMNVGPVSDGSKTESGGKTENEAVDSAGDEAMATTPPTKRAKVAKKRGLFLFFNVSV